MKIDRYAVKLFLEIKHNLPYQIGRSLKLANPELDKEMGQIYLNTGDQAIKNLIAVFLGHVNVESPKPKVSIEDSSKGGPASNMVKKTKELPTLTSKRQKYYRGVLVED